MKPKFVDDWKLDKDGKKEVKKQLKKWADMFTEHAEGKTGQVRNLNFRDNNILFFTKCEDVLGNKQLPGTMRNMLVSKRKRNVAMSLFCKQLIDGKEPVWHGHCNQCGKDEKHITHLGNDGSLIYCPLCGQIKINTNVTRIDSVLKVLKPCLEGIGLLKE